MTVDGKRERLHGKTGPGRIRKTARVVAHGDEKCSNEKVVQWYAKMKKDGRQEEDV